jgi:hypothetical protein
MKSASLTSAACAGCREMTQPSGRFHRCAPSTRTGSRRTPAHTPRSRRRPTRSGSASCATRAAACGRRAHARVRLSPRRRTAPRSPRAPPSASPPAAAAGPARSPGPASPPSRSARRTRTAGIPAAPRGPAAKALRPHGGRVTVPACARCAVHRHHSGQLQLLTHWPRRNHTPQLPPPPGAKHQPVPSSASGRGVTTDGL